jgi:hypothetical protein
VTWTTGTYTFLGDPRIHAVAELAAGLDARCFVTYSPASDCAVIHLRLSPFKMKHRKGARRPTNALQRAQPIVELMRRNTASLLDRLRVENAATAWTGNHAFTVDDRMLRPLTMKLERLLQLTASDDADVERYLRKIILPDLQRRLVRLTE